MADIITPNVPEAEYITGEKIETRADMEMCIRDSACAMLADGFSVSDTALRCGYSTSSYFCKMFKSIVSMTPSEYRRYDEDMRNI